MATKLFFRNAASDYGTGTNDARLATSTGGWVNKALNTTQGSSAVNVVTNTVAGPTNGIEINLNVTPYVWYSPPLNAAATISGSITWNLRAAESSNSANVAINGRLEVIDGASGAITLIDATARTIEVGLTTEAANNFAETPAAGVACKRGDRLRVRVYGDDAGTMGSGFTFTFWFDGATGATGDSFLTLTETLSFVAEPAGTQVFPTDTASAVVASSTLVSDFTGADESPLSEGGAWQRLNTGDSGGFQRVSNTAGPTGAGGVQGAATTADYGPNIEAALTISTWAAGASTLGIAARVQGAAGSATWDGYSAFVNPTTILLYRVLDSAVTSLGSLAITEPTAGARLGISCIGSTIQAWYQPSGGSWSPVISAVDTTYASAGKIAIRSTAGTAVRVDDLVAGGYLFPRTTREAWTSRGAGVQTDVTNTAAGWTAPIQVTDTAGGTVIDWFTRSLTAFTLGGAARCNIRAQESNIAANASVRAEIARVAADGTGATVWAAGTFPTELTASEAAQSFLVSGDDLAITSGQRLRIRLYIDDAPDVAMAASQTVTLYYAGATPAASGDTYLTFTQTLTEFVPYVPRNAAINHQDPGIL